MATILFFLFWWLQYKEKKGTPQREMQIRRSHLLYFTSLLLPQGEGREKRRGKKKRGGEGRTAGKSARISSWTITI